MDNQVDHPRLYSVYPEPGSQVETTIDIIAVHGLQTNFRTWTYRDPKSNNQDSGVDWLKDANMLPSKIPDAKIWLFDYNSNYSHDPRERRIGSIATYFLKLLLDQGLGQRSLIFIGSCFGGLVIAQALVKVWRDPKVENSSLIRNLLGAVFLGTPFGGSNAAKAAELQVLAYGIIGETTSQALLDDLKEFANTRKDLVHEFARRAREKNLEIRCFFETKPSRTYTSKFPKALSAFRKPKQLLVTEESAILLGYEKIPMDVSHTMMNKFTGPEDTRFGIVAREIKTIKDSRIGYTMDERDHQCLKDLRVTDPQDDKKRIEGIKGGLLKDSYIWILENPDFQRWRTDQESRLLWIRGDPGKGKTMLLCGIINELEKSKATTSFLSYFFCQATDSRINNALAVLRGLVYLLVARQPSLISHLRIKYDHAGKALFEDSNAWVALLEVFKSILQDPSLSNTFLVIDALDECTTDLSKLLDFIVQTSSTSPRIKWIVSSRNWPIIEKKLDTAKEKVWLCLELNEKSVSAAITKFIQVKVDKLATQNKYTRNIWDAVQQHLTLNADGTFLWVALVCQALSDLPGWKAKQKLTAFPFGLDALYQRMIDQIGHSEDAELCQRILAVISTVYQPITMDELVALVDMPEGVVGDYEALSEIIGLCGSFLTLRKQTIFFVHQSAKDFLLERAFINIFPSGIDDIHYTIFSRSLKVMDATLEQDIYRLKDPGISIDQVQPPDLDPLSAVRYSCLYWVDHLLDSESKGTSHNDLANSGSVYEFLYKRYLYWLEALSLLRGLSSGIVIIRKIENWLEAKAIKSPNLYTFVYDAKRFALYSRSIIEQRPLQAYCSALVFAPEQSIVRATFEKCIPPWIRRKPKVQTHWNAALQTLEGHTDSVNSVAFSPDGKQVVSGSGDKTVRLWDAATGQQMLPTLEGHTAWVNSVAFSPDGKQVVSGSGDNTVRLWDAATGQQVLPTLEGHTDTVNSVAFSPDGKQVVSGSGDSTVRLWDAATGQPVLPTLKGHIDSVNSVAFSPDGKQVVSGSGDKTVRLWDAATGQPVLPTLEGHTLWVNSVAFSPDGKQVVSGSDDYTVRLWDAATGQPVLPTLKGHTDSVNSVAFSPDGKQVVSGSRDNTVRLWDAATGQPVLPTLEGHTDSVNSVAFSPDGKQVVSGSYDNTVRLWDAATGQQVLPTLESKRVVSGPENQLLQHTLVVSNDWIIKDGRNILWLPPDYRTSVVAIWGGIVVLAQFLGKVSFLEFTSDI